jgi:F-type H+-transporting ATPase subunit delta
MANERLARRYATAVFSLARDANAADRIGTDLKSIADAIFKNEDAKSFFLAPIIDRADKERALAASFEGRVHEIALHTLLLLVRKHREALLPEVVEQYARLQMQARGAEPLLVTTAKALSDDALRSIVSRLEKTYRTTFDATQRIDPQLIGGLRLTLGDRRIDGTVAGRLDELSRELFTST